ncbi:MAG TPA: hypothetical protein VNX40_09295 [Mucilaginibacter sp.]|jgi:hypothetical protein|nr:hypothetical protein [Mucilaginibacter sp.]
MDETKPVNSTHDINLFKKFVLYFNVMALRVALGIPSASDYQPNYRSRGFSVAMIAVSEYATAKFISPHMMYEYRLGILLFGLCFHSLIDILFGKDIITMAGNYNAYYSRYLFYIYLVFLAVGLVGGVMTLNNEIGHLPNS